MGVSEALRRGATDNNDNDDDDEGHETEEPMMERSVDRRGERCVELEV